MDLRASGKIEEITTSKYPWFFRAVSTEIPAMANSLKSALDPNSKPNPIPKLKRMVSFVQQGDMFGFSPIVKLDSFRSLVGGFLTVCCLTGILIYIVWTSFRYFLDPVGKSQVTIDADTMGIEVPRVGVVFNLGSGGTFYDDTYFYFQMSMNVVTNSNITTKNTTQLQLTSCDFYRRLSNDFVPEPETPDPVASGVQCFSLKDYPINQIGNISGIFEEQFFRYLQVDMFKCYGVSPSGRNCSNSSTIDPLISAGEVQIMWYNTEINDVLGVDPHLNALRVWRSYRFKFATNLVVSKDIYMIKSHITHHSAWPLGKTDNALDFSRKCHD